MSEMATFSPLCNTRVATKKYSSRQGKKVSRLIIHYTCGGTDASNVKLLSVGERKVSATYVLRRDGSLVGIVPEEYRPWTSGGFSADGPSVTVETVVAPKGEATPAQMETLARLAADLSNRYGWGALDRKNVMGHQEFANTDCPGPYIWPRMSQIVKRANEVRSGGVKPTSPEKPKPPNKPQTPSTQKPNKSLSAMADEVIQGKHGNGHENRRKSLGVTKAVYEQVRAEVNRRVSTKNRPTPPTKSVDQMAREVIAGKHGNGHANRKKSLGVSDFVYANVRRRVNQLV